MEFLYLYGVVCVIVLVAAYVRYSSAWQGMNKVFAIIIFPIFFITAYLYRIIVYDILQGLFIDLPRAFCSNLLWGLIFALILPITVVLDIFTGFIVVLIVSFDTCSAIFRGDIDFAGGFAEIFRNKKRR